MSKFTILERNDILAKSGGVCACCGEKLNLVTLSIDHYIPVSRGGHNCLNNLYPLCVECNKNKDSDMYYHDECYPLLNVGYDSTLDSLYTEWESRYRRDLWNNLDYIVVSVDYQTSQQRASTISKDVLQELKVDHTKIFTGSSIQLGCKDKLKRVYEHVGAFGIPKEIEVEYRDVKYDTWIHVSPNTAIKIVLKSNANMSS